MDASGDHWLACQRPRWPEAPVMLCNLHTGALVLPLDVEGWRVVGVSLDTLLRIIPQRCMP